MVMRVRWTDGSPGSRLSWFLVAVQGVLFAGVGLAPASWGPTVPSLGVWGAALFVAGSAGILWAALSLGQGLTPLAEPNGTGIAAHGAFRWVRHPMYSAVLVASLGVALARGSFFSEVLVVVLAVFFEIKTRREERFLVAAYEGYAGYAARTGKFVPGLGRPRLRSQSGGTA